LKSIIYFKIYVFHEKRAHEGIHLSTLLIYSSKGVSNRIWDRFVILCGLWQIV